jgi:uncharacterized membrane protein
MNFITNHPIKIFIGVLIAVLLFHICIITKIIPYSIAWGGRLQNDTEMYVFETISIFINLFLVWILLMKGNYVKFQFSEKILKVILWIFFAVFLLNTIGNLFAKTLIEKQFSILTAILAILLWIILVKNNNGSRIPLVEKK